MKSAKTMPTIKALLNSMPPTGTDSHEDRLSAYSTLGFYYDGQDRSNASVRSIRSLIIEMDGYASPLVCPNPEQLEDDEHDRYGVRFGDTEVWFRSPSIANMPKRGSNIAAWYRTCIETLAENPEEVLGLPYLYFSPLCEALGKSLGLS